MTTATVDLDAGARWSEASRLARAVALQRQAANVGSIEVNATLWQRPASAFTLDAATFMAATAASKRARSRFVVRDLGGLDLIVPTLPENKTCPPNAARRMVVEPRPRPSPRSSRQVPFVGAADAVHISSKRPAET